MKHIFKKVLLSFALAAVLAFSAFAINIDLVEAEISGSDLTMIVGLSDTTGDEFVSIALYDENGRMTGYYPISTQICDLEHVMFIQNWDTSSVTAKVFAMADKTSMEPLTEPVEISLPKIQKSELIFVTPDSDGNTLDTSSGTQTYAHVWVNGNLKYVPVNTKADVYPRISQNTMVSYTEALSTYTVDKDGVYTITPIAGFTNSKSQNVGLDDIENIDFAGNRDDSYLLGQFAYYGYARLTKTNSGNLQLIDDYGNRIKDYNNKDLPNLIVDENTTIIIKNKYTSGNNTNIDFLQFGSSIKSTVQRLTNIQIILENNTGDNFDTAEKLVALYAETVENEKLSFSDEIINDTTTEDEEVDDPATEDEEDEEVDDLLQNKDRIISKITLIKNTDGEFVYSYEVINPYTGMTDTLLGTHTVEKASAAVSPFALGDVVRVYGGKIADDENDNGAISNISHATANLYWVLDMYDNGELLVGGIPEDGSEPTTTYRISIADATVIMVGRQVQSGANMYRYAGGHVVGFLDTLADNVSGNATNYKAVSASYWDANDKLVRAYGKYVKVYLNIDWENADHSANGDGVHGKAAYIVAVANNNENQKYCDMENPVKA